MESAVQCHLRTINKTKTHWEQDVQITTWLNIIITILFIPPYIHRKGSCWPSSRTPTRTPRSVSLPTSRPWPARPLTFWPRSRSSWRTNPKTRRSVEGVVLLHLLYSSCSFNDYSSFVVWNLLLVENLSRLLPVDHGNARCYLQGNVQSKYSVTLC